jgi:hypothetical protein
MEKRQLRWWVRFCIDFEHYLGPYEAEGHARRDAAEEKCETEVLQDAGIDNGHLELTGGQWLSPARYFVFRSGKVVRYSPEMLREWVQKEFR